MKSTLRRINHDATLCREKDNQIFSETKRTSFFLFINKLKALEWILRQYNL